ncbi:phosphate ABC transporter substrate-binding protein [Photobacterium angustum]|uniref:phosphate ABC transporter substrate-binding protein n=1 Tax=Photobacterium angustum TaxID=661 RepID=UPI0005DA9F1B|nr:phosphate ABC transporter substrate-binding protein [Photobacterium angustum]KJG17747.1 phosphate ABC transporter substrate-binding protein [Photobacterium angustum]KJG24954.1 phosphate ABC transporter substrate-binding protein [Photobacterium angustum]KJG32917.1 phosphate ABC transporter substrate-binding protein [Photobacterium angustum]PSW97535.1 phosphate ABC transporter substrate-binding protein [Photobacterium angustum]PSX00640.1 phosphate ABC transporter substrate-binding protein [Ph
MLKTVIRLLALGVCISFSVQAKETVTVVGSTSVSHIMDVLADTYSSTHKDTTIEVQGIGSTAGINAVKQGAAEIGMSSRVISSAELDDNYKAITIAHDGIALVVNKANPVTNLTREQLIGIYQGKITNWKSINGKDLDMAVVSRENASGSRFSFEHFMGLTKQVSGFTVSNISPRVLVVSTNGMVKSLVSRNEHAIGYVSLGSVDDSVKALSYDNVLPTAANIESGEYKIARPFLLMFKQKGLANDAQQFIKFVLSNQAQSIIKDKGYVAIDKKA